MAYTTRAALASGLAFFLACSPTSKFPNGITAATHRWFPLTAGTNHALGKGAADGVISCNSCHALSDSSFKSVTCTGCHEHEIALTDSLHLNTAGYHTNGSACLSCHLTGERRAFDHFGIAGECASCHDVGTVFAALPKSGFTHPDVKGADCSLCHATSAWAGAKLFPAAAVSDPLAALTIDALIPFYQGTSISSVSPQLESFSMNMNHGTTQVGAAAFSACSNCHQNADSGSLYPGVLHSSLANLKLPQPTQCSDCHRNALPTGFVGPLATSPVRSPTTGEMKHDAVSWEGGATTLHPLLTADCGVCHSPSSLLLTTSWATGRSGNSPAAFHSSLTAAGKPQPSSCLDCHANSRPNTVLSAPAATLPPGLQFDHGTSLALQDCAGCHLSGIGTDYKQWSSARFHPPGSSAPATCLPCHAGERPTSTGGWTSPTYTSSPFDTVPNVQGITHGAGQDCAVCHSGPGTGAWGAGQNWVGGHFTHTSASLAGTTCVACHSTQRPDLQPGTTPAAMAALLGFDHSINGTGDCVGCHQATVVANTYLHYNNAATGKLPNGDWKAGISYPGSTFISGADQFVSLTELLLNRSPPNNLVTGITTLTATLYNGMLHVSSAVPAAMAPGPSGMPDNTKCWHCHTNAGGTVSSFANGKYHAALSSYSATPGGAVSPFPQPSSKCEDCHASMRPTGVVQKAASDLQAMDHAALFTQSATVGGVVVNGVSGVPCSTCHGSPGTTWADGLFHSKIGGAVPQDCTTCHFPLMADAARSDVTSATRYAMRHRSGQLTVQNCRSCHATAFAKAATSPATAALFNLGTLHSSVSSQPSACAECHTLSQPAANASTQSSWTYVLLLGGTATNAAQWMNHGSSSVAGKDCAVCHGADAKAANSQWSKSSMLHAVVSAPSTCTECHGLGNGGGSIAGTRNNLPAGLSNSSTVTVASASSSTGIPPGTLDQIDHADVNVTGHDCKFCHTQAGISGGSLAGKEWAQAKFHRNFTAASPLVMNTTTGRCSSCHLNVKPRAGYPAQDHAAFTSVSGSQDCSSCHGWPGTGTASAPNWLGAAGVPSFIFVGGFSIAQPPAASATVQPGITGLPHPSVSGRACTACHTAASGGRPAMAYDHASALIASNCGSCHEAGSPLVTPTWNGATATAPGAGDTRPYTLASVVYRSRSIPYPNHFYPADCKQCHVAPSGVAGTLNGAGFRSAWTFPHSESRMTNPSTCKMCHTNGIPN